MAEDRSYLLHSGSQGATERNDLQQWYELVRDGHTEGIESLQELLAMYQSSTAVNQEPTRWDARFAGSAIFHNSHVRAVWNALSRMVGLNEVAGPKALIQCLEPSTISSFVQRYLKGKGETTYVAARRLIKFLIREAFPSQLHPLHTRLLLGLINGPSSSTKRKPAEVSDLPPLLNTFIREMRMKGGFSDPEGTQFYRETNGYWRTSLYGCRRFLRWVAERRGCETVTAKLERSISGEDLIAYRNHLASRVARREITDASAALNLRVVRKWAVWMNAQGYLPRNITQRLKALPVAAQPLRVYVTESEFHRFVAGLRAVSPDYPRDYTFLCLTLYTGCRPCEALRLRLRDVSRDFAKVILHGKEGVAREAPIGGKLQEILRYYIASIPPGTENVFSNVRGQPLQSKCLGTIWRKAREVASLPPSFNRRALRHHRALEYVLDGEDMNTIMVRMGWTTPKMLTTYADPSVEMRRVMLGDLPLVGGVGAQDAPPVDEVSLDE